MMAAMRALLVEDDATIADFIVRGLREAGFAVDHVADGEAGLMTAARQPYDVAIVDLMLPKRDGLSLIGELRRRGVATPVLILGSASDVRCAPGRCPSLRNAAPLAQCGRANSRGVNRVYDGFRANGPRFLSPAHRAG